jgi:hypothetical protein
MSKYSYMPHKQPSLKGTEAMQLYLIFYFFYWISLTYNILAMKPLNNYITPVIQQTPIQRNTQKHPGSMPCSRARWHISHQAKKREPEPSKIPPRSPYSCSSTIPDHSHSPPPPKHSPPLRTYIFFRTPQCTNNQENELKRKKKKTRNSKQQRKKKQRTSMTTKIITAMPTVYVGVHVWHYYVCVCVRVCVFLSVCVYACVQRPARHQPHLWPASPTQDFHSHLSPLTHPNPQLPSAHPTHLCWSPSMDFYATYIFHLYCDV